MEYTAKERETIVKHLKNALKNLPNRFDKGYSPYICDNIRITNRLENIDLAIDLIHKRIDGKFSLEQWLKDQSPEIAQEVREDILFYEGQKLQAHRRAWLKKLIAEFETAGV